MKKIKIFIILGAFLSAGLLSCNMEKLPQNETKAEVRTVQEAELLRTGLYAGLKGISSSPGSLLHGDYQADLFHVPANYGNFFGWAYRWNIDASQSDIEGYWYARYSAINDANFLLEGIDWLRENLELTSSEQAKLNLYEGEALLYRAINYYNLVLRFCKAYDSSTANDPHSGVMIVLTAMNTPDKHYPRETLAASYKRITDDIAAAEELITTVLSATNIHTPYYFTTDVVQAFKARVALSMKDYQTALDASLKVINSGRYELTSSALAFKGMWQVDNDVPTTNWDGVNYSETQKELLMVVQIFSASADTPQATGQYFLDYLAGGGNRPQFLPTLNSLNKYDQDNDIRFPAYFIKKSFGIANLGSASLYMVNKYPGNKKLHSTTYTLGRHKGKLFRLAEQYLIAAEAYYFLNNTAGANEMLNAIRSKRITNWEEQTYSGDDLFDEIKLERFREMYAEGNRLFDLKRWGEGFDRGITQNDILIMTGPQYSDMTVDPDNYRFVWPIPKRELDQNTAMEGQQNPGY